MHRRDIIFATARGISDAGKRKAYLEAACAGNQRLQHEIESLLNADECCGNFLKTGPARSFPLLPQPSEKPRFGDYELLEEIARGGMGVVYKARQVSLNRVVAVKMILSGQFASDAEVKRFHSEAQAAASLNHRNIVAIYEVGAHQGQHYFTMPFLEGQSLAQLVESGQWRPQDGTEAARLMVKIARAVQHAHDAGILHRDLKPGNILIDAEGEPCITDFGLAKQAKAGTNLTLTGQVLGTPGFMAPEQARGKSGQTTVASDIYSLGAVLYYLLTRRPPFVADSPLDALLLALESEAVLPRRINPLVAGALEQICLRCMQKKPEARYASAGDLALDLERYLKGEPMTLHPQAIGRRFEAWAKRRPALATHTCTVVVCFTILLISWRHYTPERVAELAVLVLWLVISILCQRGVDSGRHGTLARYVWSGADPAILTAILLLAQASHSPLVMLYPTMIAGSGFWFRVPLVTTTTIVSVLGYLVLAVDNGILTQIGAPDSGQPETAPFRWHVLALVAMIVTGLTVAYLVNRVRALTRFYEAGPPAPG